MTDITDRLRAAPKDRRLWEEFYNQFYSEVYYTAYKLSRGNAALAKDATHDAFLRYFRYRAYRRTRGLNRTKAYLRQTARRLIWQYYRAREVPTADHELQGYADSAWQVSFDQEDSSHLREDLDALLSVLKPEERELYAMRLEGRRYKDIAAHMGITIEAVTQRWARLLKKMRSSIK